MGQPAFLPPKLIDLVEKNALQRSEGPQRKTIKQIIEQEKNLGWAAIQGMKLPSYMGSIKSQYDTCREGSVFF